ncbi:pyocin knob domain-containing protein [Aeromonas sanarellii]|uniref:pyocin knob domain-containing protein n=1 Tax=Aeromonas sanarellii TaxID=633415 RepID=UPI0038D140BF
MANEYYERLSEMNPGDLADGLAMEAEFDAISQGFSKLPTPHTGGQGFDGPVRVGDAVNDDEAVNLGQLQAAIGEAVLLPIATYGNLAAAAWGTLASNTYLLFGTGAQFSNTPYTLVAGATYYLQVRHVIGGAGVAIYHDTLSLASTDDSANVDLRRLFVRTGSTFAAANTGGWVGFSLKKAALTALESLTPAADRVAYYTSAGAAAMATLTAFARTLLDDANAAAMRATLGAAVAFSNLTTENLNDLTEYGLYAQQASASATLALNYPIQEAGSLVLRPTAYLYQQEYTTFNSLRKFIRNRSASSVWSAWVEVYTQKSILGDVSQSAGVPTGAILRRGSNANGEYLQMADGTQICWRNWTANLAVTSDNTPYTGYYYAGLVFTYPVAFVAPPTLTAGARAAGYTTPVANADISSVSAGLYIISNRTITARDYVLSYVAIGRWF